MEDDLDFEKLEQFEQQWAASKQQQCLQSAAPPSAWQTGAGHQQPAQQSGVQHFTAQRNTLQQQTQHITQQGHPAWPDQQAPVLTKQTHVAPWPPAAKPFAPHNSTQTGSLHQQSMGQLQGQQQQSWQMQQSCLNQTVQGVWQPQAQQQLLPPAATMCEHSRPAQQQPIAQQQQQHVHREQPQQGSILQPSQQHSNQQQLQQQTTLNRLMHAPHHAGGPTQQLSGTAGSVAAVSGPEAAPKALSICHASSRPTARPVVHQDDKMLPYQQQPAVQQRKHAAQQQHRGSKQLLQASAQTGILNHFPVDHLKHQQMAEQRAQQQQALHKRQQQQQQLQLAQVSVARQKQLPHQGHKQSTAEYVEDVDILEILSDEEDAGLPPAQAADPPSAQQQQQQQQFQSWDVPHHQQQPDSCHQQSSHPPHHHQQQQQPHQHQHRPQQRSKPQVQTVEDPQEVLRLMAMAWPGGGQADGDPCSSQELSECPASTLKGDSLGAPDRRVNAAAAKTWLYPAGSVREYQYQIAHTAIKHNTLACLPTGLGKTLIAAVVMYNFYRWFPRAKIAFVAPTRPLVEQQLKECQRIMGFHQDDAAKLLNTPAAKRRDLWTTKRLVFSTPQTLENDLKTGACPSSALVCLVVDECHRATGDHSMANVVKLLRQSGEKFRVLALSATPGNDHRAIQEVIKNMMINKVDFRSEDDDSIKQYCHQRTVDTCVVPVSHEAKLIQQQLLHLMHPLVMELNRTCQANLMVPNERKLLCQHTVLEARRRHQASGSGTNANSTASRSTKPLWAKGKNAGSNGLNSLNPKSTLDFSYQVAINWEALSIVARLGDAFEDRGANAALEQVYAVQQEADAGAAAAAKVAGGLYAGSGGGVQRTGRLVAAALGKLRSQGAYNDLVERLKVLSAHPHPKLQHLGDQLQQHFTLQQQQQQQQAEAPDISRAIVFCSYRDQVSMLAQYLRQFEPEIVCRPFVGQGNSTKKGGKAAAAAGTSGGGRKKTAAAAAADAAAGNFADDSYVDDPALVGMKQAEQKRVLEDFRAGEFNVLLATCIGEEGLDIPQVDLIVCWDSGGNPSRARQRMGRTGRSRPGHVVYLLSEGKELEKYQTNLEREKQVKEYLRCADQRFELSHQEVPLLPPNVTPTPTLIAIPQPPEKATHKGRGTKRKSSGADADEAAPAAAAAARKRPGKKAQQQQLGYSHPAAAAGDSAALGVGYAALKRAQTVRKATRVVESSDDGWESEGLDDQQQQQQQLAWQSGAAAAGIGNAAAAGVGGGCTVGQVYEWERDQPHLDLDDDGDAFVDGAEINDAEMPLTAAAEAAATTTGPTRQQRQQQQQCVLGAAGSDSDVDVDVPLATRKQQQKQQQQGVFGDAESDSELDESLAARKQLMLLRQQQQQSSLGSDGDLDVPLLELAKKRRQQQQQQQHRQIEAYGGINCHGPEADLDTPLIVRQEQAKRQQQRQQPAKRAVKKLVSRKNQKAAAAAAATAGLDGVAKAHCSPSAAACGDNKLLVNAGSSGSSGGLAANAKLAAAAAACGVEPADWDDGAAGTVFQGDAGTWNGDIDDDDDDDDGDIDDDDDDEYCQLIEFEQAQQQQEQQELGTSPKAAAAAAADQAASDCFAAAAAAAQVFSFDAVDGRFMLGPRATAVLLPQHGWLTKQLLQQQQQYSPGATAAESCVPETPLPAAAAGATSAAAAAGLHSVSRQPAAAAGTGESVASVLSELLDQLMEPMSAAEMKVAAAQLGEHSLAGLALLPQLQQQHQCGPEDDSRRSHPGIDTRSPAAAAAAVAEVQQASQDSMDVASDPDDDGAAANAGVDDTGAAAAVPWRVKTREEIAAAAREARAAAAAAAAAAKGSVAAAAAAHTDIPADCASDLLEDVPLAQRLQEEMAAPAAAGSKRACKHKRAAAAAAAVGKKGKAAGSKRGKKQQQQQHQQGGSQSDGLGDLPLALLPAAYPAAARAARRRSTAAAAATGVPVPALQPQQQHASIMHPAAAAVAAAFSNAALQQRSDTAADANCAVQEERPAERAHGAVLLANNDEANDNDDALEDMSLAQRKNNLLTVAMARLPCTAAAAVGAADLQQQGLAMNTDCAVVLDSGDGIDDSDDFIQDVPLPQRQNQPSTGDPIPVVVEMPIGAATAAAGDALDIQQIWQQQQQQQQHQDVQQRQSDPSEQAGSCHVVAAAAGGAKKLGSNHLAAAPSLAAAAATEAADSTDDWRNAAAAKVSMDAEAAPGQQQQLASLAHALGLATPQEHQRKDNGCIASPSQQRQCSSPDVDPAAVAVAAAAAGASESMHDSVQQSSPGHPTADAGVLPPPAARSAPRVAAAAVKPCSAAAAAAAADLTVTGAAAAPIAAAAAVTAGSPNSWSDDEPRQQQQQQPPKAQLSWRSLGGLGRNRSRAVRRQQQFAAASWDDVCTQPAHKNADTAPATTATTAAAAAELAGVSGDVFVRPVAIGGGGTWDDFFTQPQQQHQQQNEEENPGSQYELGDSQVIACNVNGDQAPPSLGPDQGHENSHTQQQQQQQQELEEEEESGLPVRDLQVQECPAHAEKPCSGMDQGHEQQQQQQLECMQQQEEEEPGSPVRCQSAQVLEPNNAHAERPMLSLGMDQGHEQQQLDCAQQPELEAKESGLLTGDSQVVASDANSDQLSPDLNWGHKQGGTQQQQQDNTQQQQQQDNTQQQQQQQAQEKLGREAEEAEPRAAPAGDALQPNADRAKSSLHGMMCEMQLHHGHEEQHHHQQQQQQDEFSGPGLGLPDGNNLQQTDALDWVPDTEQQQRQQHSRQQLLYEGQQRQQQQQHSILADLPHAADMTGETPAAAQLDQQQQQHAAETSALLPPQQQQQQPEDDLKLNRQLQFDQEQVSLMSPPPARTPGSALARRSSMQSAARAAARSSGVRTVKFGSGFGDPAAAAAAAREIAGSGRCTWEADDVRDLDWQFRLANSSSSSKPSSGARSAAAAAAARSGGLSKVLDRSGKQLRISGSSGGGSGLGLRLGFKTPGSDDLGMAAAGFKRRRRRAPGVRRAIMLTQLPGNDDSPPTAAAAAADAGGLAEGCNMQDSGIDDGNQLQQQQPEGRLKKRRLQPAAATAGPSKCASKLYAAKQQRQQKAAKPAAAASDDEEGMGWVARKKARKAAAAAVVVAAKRNNRRCVFIDEAAADSDPGGDDQSDDDDANDDNDDLSGFITSATETPSAATDRSTPGMALYQRSMHTQTPVNSDGKVDMWAILHGRNRERPERYQRQDNDRQQGGQHTTAATTGGWHNARPKQQQQQHGVGCLLDSPEDGDAIGSDDEPYGLTLRDTPSDYNQSGGALDEYETEDEAHGEEVQSGDESDRGVHSEEQDGWEVQGDRQQKKKRRKQQLLSESEDCEEQPSAAMPTAGHRGVGQADRTRDWGHTRARSTGPGAADAAGRGADVILLDSSSGDRSEDSDGDGDTDSDDDSQGSVQRQQQRRRQQQRQRPSKVPALALAVTKRTLQPGSKRRQVISSSDSDDAPDVPGQRQRGGATKPLTGDDIGGDSEGQDLSDSDDRDDGHFDECNICGEQGELLMCDAPSCPLAYHVECVGLRKVPDGDWICPACSGDLQG